MNATRWLSLVLLVAVAALACGDDPEAPAQGTGGMGGDDTRREVARIEVTLLQPLLVIGQELQLEARALDADGEELEARIGWTSTDPAVAFVSDEGLVLALAKGSAGIVAVVDDVVEMVTLQVEKVAKTLALPERASLGIGHSQPVGLIFEDEDGDALSPSRIEWTFSRADIARVDEEALLHGIGWGETTVTARVEELEAHLEVRTYLRFGTIRPGDHHTCALTQVGEAFCWGAGDHGRLGNVIEGSSQLMPLAPVQGGLRFSHLAAGARHNCGLDEAGVAHCWGDNGDGQLGPDLEGYSAAPVAIEGVPALLALDAAGSRTCGLDGEGRAHCWGGERGQGPEAIEAPMALRSIAVGERHTCGLGEEGEVVCWGSNDRGQLGVEPSAGSEAPVVVEGLPPLTSLAAGAHHTCGISGEADRRVHCWGGNLWGELGRGEVAPWGPPAPIGSAYPFLQIALGTGLSCGVSSGGAFCWGANESLQVGSVATEEVVPTPTKIGPGPWTFHGVEAGGAHACALTSSGEALCWGSNAWGQLGSDACDEDSSPCRANMPHAVGGQR